MTGLTCKNPTRLEAAMTVKKGHRTRPSGQAAAPQAVREIGGDTRAGLRWRLLCGNASDALRSLKSDSVNAIVTSPPYYWQRDYGVAGQIGHEPAIQQYVDALTAVFREARRVLASDGLLFLNLGDTYYSAKGKPHGSDKKHSGRQLARKQLRAVDGPGLGLPRKSLIGIPWRVARALQEDGWTLRSDIIWFRPTALGEPSASDRPWRLFEHVFMFAKSPKYFFNRTGLSGEEDVWTLKARPANPHSHFAPFPAELVERCLACGCKPKGVVLDPFVGSGTTMLVALAQGRHAIGIDLKREYCIDTLRRLRDQERHPAAGKGQLALL